MAQLITVEHNGSTYQVLRQGNDMYRRESGEIGHWQLYGGAVHGKDFQRFGTEIWSGSPFALPSHEIVGLGENAGKPLKDIARPELQVGDTLLAHPIDSPRAKQIGDGDQTYALSGKVTEIKEIDNTKDITSVL